MLILGVDTSGKNGGIALVEFSEHTANTLEIVPLEGGTFSAQLVPQISELLTRQRRTKRDLDGFAIVSGPGSFTGLRVGLAAIKGLAEVLQKPIATVSLLEAIANVSGKKGQVLAALDAGRGEMYVAQCDVSTGRVSVHLQQLVSPSEFAATVDGRLVITPDTKLSDLARSQELPATLVTYPRADVVARIGYEKIKAGDVVSVESLDANYIRRSDAEIKFAEK